LGFKNCRKDTPKNSFHQKDIEKEAVKIKLKKITAQRNLF
jgi:hypothetical protein